MNKEELVQAWFLSENKTLALAESCTGGHVSARLVCIPGASNYFLGSLVTYSNQMKQSLLGVKEKTLTQFGAVSRETALEMLEGVLARTVADVALAVTGIAGPTGGTAEKPVGTIWVAVGARGQQPHLKLMHVNGGRQEIILRTANVAIEFLFEVISS